MRITVNGQILELGGDVSQKPMTVERLLEEMLPQTDATARSESRVRGACAVEVNKRLVPRREHSVAVLHDGDSVEIVTLVGGG